MMKKYLLFILIVLIPTVLMAQAAGGAIKRTPKKTETVKEEPKKKEAKKQQSERHESKKRQEAVKPAEEAGYDVTFSCNVPSATLSIDGIANGSASGTRFLKTGSHSIRLTANGYEPLSRTITVNRSSTSFTFTMKQEECKLSPVLQALVKNMVLVEGGTFTMGATVVQGSDAESDERPAHLVTLSSFSIGKYEVTQEEWETVMGSNPSRFKGAKRPVEQVSWDDCQAFIRKLNQLTGKRFRLPTEAEWEYAASGGPHKYVLYKYAGSDNLGSVAWYTHNSGNETHPVGQKLPNRLGLYDMSGNVWEWCQDWKGSYSSSAQTNPTGPSSGSFHIRRGGSWDGFETYCRSSNRRYFTPSDCSDNLGLRIAAEAEVKTVAEQVRKSAGQTQKTANEVSAIRQTLITSLTKASTLKEGEERQEIRNQAISSLKNLMAKDATNKIVYDEIIKRLGDRIATSNSDQAKGHYLALVSKLKGLDDRNIITL